MAELVSRPTPFELVFRSLANERFATVREALAAGGVDPFDRDAFLMMRPVVELVHALRPEEGVGDAMAELIALTHLGYLFWDRGERTVRVSPAAAATLLGPAPTREEEAGEGPDAYYVQYPPRRIWGEPLADAPPEPLDGCFIARTGDVLSVAAVFGLHPDRAAFSVVEVAGSRPDSREREDGQPLFTSTLSAGPTAGLHSVTGMGELLELAWRSDDLARVRARDDRHPDRS